MELSEERNLTIPRDVEDIPIEKGVEAGEHPKVNGFDLYKTVKEYTEVLHKIIPDGEHRINVPELRARGTDQNISGLEGIVKGIFGSNLRADSELASKTIVSLFAEGLKTEGFRFDPDDPITKEITDYLKGDTKIEDFSDLSEPTREALNRFYTRAASAIGDPTVGDILTLKQAIINMQVAKPGDVAYDKNSVLGKIINYIAGQMDNPIPGQKNNTPRRVAYLQEELINLAKYYKLELVRMFNKVLPKERRLSATASIQQILEAYQTSVGVEATKYNAALEKTYTLPERKAA